MSFADDLRKTSNYVNSNQRIQDTIQKIVNNYITGAVSELKDAATEAARNGATYISGIYHSEEVYFEPHWKRFDHFTPDGRNARLDYKMVKGDSRRDTISI